MRIKGATIDAQENIVSTGHHTLAGPYSIDKFIDLHVKSENSFPNHNQELIRLFNMDVGNHIVVTECEIRQGNTPPETFDQIFYP